VIDLSEIDKQVAAVDLAKNRAQSAFDYLKEDLDGLMAEAFRRLWPGKTGDRIRAVTHYEGTLEGRAVIHTNGTKWTLYVDTGIARHAVCLPYDKNVTILPKYLPLHYTHDQKKYVWN
jgi:hypothetical protein